MFFVVQSILILAQVVLLTTGAASSNLCIDNMNQNSWYTCLTGGPTSTNSLQFPFEWTLTTSSRRGIADEVTPSPPSNLLNQAYHCFSNHSCDDGSISFSKREGSDYFSNFTFTSSMKLTANIPSGYSSLSSFRTKLTCGFSGDNGSEICSDMLFYRLPRQVFCNFLGPDDDGDMTVECLGSETVKDKMICDFYLTPSGGTEVKIKDDLVAQTDYSMERNYKDGMYGLDCTTSFHINRLAIGINRVKVYVYPDFPGGETRGENATYSHDLKMTPPEPVITCPQAQIKDGYIRGKSINCFCRASPNLDQTTKARWMAGNQEVKELNSDGSLKFSVGNLQSGIDCKVTSSQGSIIHPYRPNFAFMDKDAWTLWSGSEYVSNSKIIRFNVRADPLKSQPDLNITVKANVSSEIARFNGSHMTGDTHMLVFQVVEGGVYRFDFNISNAVFDDIRYSSTMVEKVVLSPQFPPRISINGHEGTTGEYETSENIRLESGLMGDVRCEILGGYPATNVTLSCGNKYTAHGVGEAEIKDIIFGPSMDGQFCNCSGHHIRPYTLGTKSVLLHVDSTLRVDSFTANSVYDDVTSRLVVSKGATPTLTCAATGNGPFELTLERKRGQEKINATQSNEHVAQIESILSPLGCLDSDIYWCTAENRKRTSRRDMQIFVRCASQLHTAIPSPLLVFSKIGSVAHFSIDVAGYPYPTTIKFEKTKQQSDSGSLGRDSFKAQLNALLPSVVRVDIIKMITKAADFTNYQLTIGNEIDEPFVLDVKVEESSQQDLEMVEGKTTKGPEKKETETVGKGSGDLEYRKPETKDQKAKKKIGNLIFYIVVVCSALAIVSLLGILTFCHLKHRKQMEPFIKKKENQVKATGYRSSLDWSATAATIMPDTEEFYRSTRIRFDSTSSDQRGDLAGNRTSSLLNNTYANPYYLREKDVSLPPPPDDLKLPETIKSSEMLSTSPPPPPPPDQEEDHYASITASNYIRLPRVKTTPAPSFLKARTDAQARKFQKQMSAPADNLYDHLRNGRLSSAYDAIHENKLKKGADARSSEPGFPEKLKESVGKGGEAFELKAYKTYDRIDRASSLNEDRRVGDYGTSGQGTRDHVKRRQGSAGEKTTQEESKRSSGHLAIVNPMYLRRPSYELYPDFD